MDELINQKLKKDILKNWANFLYSLMIPNAIIPILMGIIITSISFFILSSLISKLMYLSGAILFSLGSSGIKNNYEKHLKESVLLQKSKSATRNLKAVTSHCKRISIASKKLSSQKANQENIKELIRSIESISMHVDLGIEDWEDIVPELKNKRITPKNRHKRKTYNIINNNNNIPIASFCSYCSQQNNNKTSDSHSKCPLLKITES